MPVKHHRPVRGWGEAYDTNKFYSREELMGQLTEIEFGRVHHRSSVFLRRLADELKLRAGVVEDASVFVERYFTAHSYKSWSPYLVDAAALWLAGQRHGIYRSDKQVALAYFRVKNARSPDQLSMLATNPDAKLRKEGLLSSLAHHKLSLELFLNGNLAGYPVRQTLAELLEAQGVHALRPKAKLCVHKSYASNTPPSHLTPDQQRTIAVCAVGLVPAIFKTHICVMYPATKTAAVLSAFASQHFNLPLGTLSESQQAVLCAKHRGDFSFTDAEYTDIMTQILAHVDLSPSALTKSAPCGTATKTTSLTPLQPVVCQSASPSIEPGTPSPPHPTATSSSPDLPQDSFLCTPRFPKAALKPGADTSAQVAMTNHLMPLQPRLVCKRARDEEDDGAIETGVHSLQRKAKLIRVV